MKSFAAYLISPFPSARIVLVVAVAVVSLLTACKVPEDPYGTTGQVTKGTLKVGALMEPLDEVETRAVARIADTLQAQTDIVTGDPHSLFAQLDKGELHIVAGRIPSNTPFAPHVGLTDPVAQVTVGDETKDRVLAIRKGENQFLVTVNRAIRRISQ